MAPLNSMARQLARTKFGQKALSQPEEPGIITRKPTTRLYVGLALMALSYLISLPALGFLTYLTVKMSKPMIIAVGGPVVFGLVHVMFGVGVYLAGKNYAMQMLVWVTKRFLQKYA